MMPISRFTSMPMLRKAMLCIALLLTETSSLRAAHEKGSSRLNLASYSSVNNGVFLSDDKLGTLQANMTNYSAVGFFDRSYKNRFVFGVNRYVTSLGAISSLLTNNVYRAEIDVLIVSNTMTLMGNTLVSSLGTTVRTFTVSFSGFNAYANVSAPATETDLDVYNFANSYQTLASISAIRIYNSNTSTTPLSTSAIPANLYIELQSDAERYYNLSNTSLPAFANNGDLQVSYLTGSSTGNEVEVKWKRINGAEAYDLEWLWLDEYTYGDGTHPANTWWTAAPVLSFRNNATRIRTDQNTYRISNIYESGHLFFRIRGVGQRLTPSALISSGNPALCDYYTGWTWPDTSVIAAQPGSYGTSGVAGASVPWYIDLRSYAHESNKNWTYTGAYAEGGKKKEVVSYFDGAQYNRQSVTRNNSDNVAIVGETYYDYVGRPTIDALPTPVPDATIKFYQQSITGGGTAFNFIDGTASAYDKLAFSVSAMSNACSMPAPGFHNGYGTGAYYSSNNTFQNLNYNNGYTPDAETYPFSQKEYMPDNTGRLSREGNVGSQLQIKAAGDLHDTRYLYSSVRQDELDRLFGSEAGYSDHYSKKTTIDANGGVTISYLNQEGKVVATALSEGAPSNLNPLMASDGSDLSKNAGYQETDLLRKQSPGDYDTPQDANKLQSDELVFTEDIAVASPRTYYFSYSLVANSGYISCPGICYDCVYDLTFDIKDNCGNRPLGFTPIVCPMGTVTGTYPGISSNPTLGINHVGGDNPVSFSFQQILPSGTNSLAVSLDAGIYTISKHLSVNKDALSWYMNDYIATCVKSPAKYDSLEALNLSVAGCNLTCDQCAANLGTQASFTANLVATNPSITVTQAIAQYAAARKVCYAPCQQNDYCQSMIDIMLTDMAPNGQYAEFTGAGATATASSFALSVFNDNSKLQRRAGAGTAPWRNPQNYANVSQNCYVDDAGAPDLVVVTQTALNAYDPPLLPAAATTLVAGTNDQYYAYPTDLLNVGDFIASFKPGWARSLLKYHPEYPYIQWCLQNKTQTVTPVAVVHNNYTGTVVASTSTAYINNSFGFDSLYAAIDDIDNIASSSYNVIFNPLTYDPYWSTTGVYYVSSNTTQNFSGTTPVNLPNTAEYTDNTGAVHQCLNAGSAAPADFTGVSNFEFDQRSNKTANSLFYNYKGTGYSLIQVAAYLATPLASQPGQTMSSQMAALLNTSGGCTSVYYPGTVPTGPMDFNYILQLKKPCSPSSDDEYKRKAWNNFKTLYATLKQEMQSGAVESYVMNSSNRGCNNCIGQPAFDVKSVKYTTYSNQVGALLLSGYNASIPSAPFYASSLVNYVVNLVLASRRDWYKYPTIYTLNQEQECGLLTKDLYLNKIRRYNIIESTAVDPSALSNTGASIYQQTGLCPVAYDLQNFLNGMAQGRYLFNTTFDLSANIPAFSQNLYQAIQPSIPSPFVPAIYNYNTSLSTSSNLAAQISIGAANTGLALRFPASAPSVPAGALSWANYQGGSATYTLSHFTNLVPTGFVNQFNVTGVVLGGNGSNPPITYTVPMFGDANIMALTGCTFAPQCKPNGLGNAVNALLNAFVTNAEFPAPYTTSYQTGSLMTPAPSPYAYVFTNSLKPILETPGNSNTGWTWSYAGGDIVIQDGSTVNKKLKISFAVPASPAMSCFQTFQTFRPDPGSSGGGFLMDGIVSNIAAITACPNGSTALSGTVSIGVYTGGSWVYTPLNIGNCGFDLGTCNTEPHQVKRDLEQLVLSANAGFTGMVTSAVSDVSGNLYLTPLLRSYLNNGISSNSSGPQQNYFWWYRDAANTSTSQVSGWLCVNTSSVAPVAAPGDGCKITIARQNTGTTGITSLLSSIGNVFQLVSSPSVNGSVFSARLVPAGAGSNDTLLLTTTCFPMRACGTLTCSSKAPIVIQNLRVSGYTPFTLKDQANTAFTVTQYSPNSVATTTLNNNTAILTDYAAVTYFANTPQITGNCSTGACSFLANGSCSVNYGANVTANNVPFLTFNSSASCPAGNCCSANIRTITYTQNFTVANTANYDIGFYSQNMPDNCVCGFNVLTAETLKVFIDNVLVNTSLLPANNTPSVYFTVPNPISAGVHMLSIQWQCSHLKNYMTLNPISLYSNNLASLPCVSPNAWPTDTMPTAGYVEPCAVFLKDLTDNTSDEKYQANLDSLKNAFARKYINRCLGRAVETLTMKYNSGDYHYTLYYYDQAGNLSRTVPPEGVKVIDLNASYSGGGTNRQAIASDRTNYGTPSYTKKIYTHHNYLTTYKYNSLNQLVNQQTPDAGLSKFYYDNLGRLVASQSAKQKDQSNANASTNQLFSYTRYDALGRIVMVGQLGTYDLDTYPVTSPQTVKDVLSDVNYPFNLSIYSGSHREVTQTYYGDGTGANAVGIGSAFSTGSQQNIRNRVCSATIEDVYDGVDNTYNHGTHYSYDIHGNVNELIQDNKDLDHFYLTQQNLKRLQYTYDLISGNVNTVTYQNNKPDMMAHSYLYDAGNRLTHVYTSRDGMLWDRDIKNFYYLHGPLARMEIGEHKVQGSDHAYTLQGWIKGVNSEGLVAASDMGRDGSADLNAASTGADLNRFTGRDGFGFALTYYEDLKTALYTDYKPVNGADASASTYFLAAHDQGNLWAQPLFNGNISQLSASYLNPDPTPVHLNDLNNPFTVYQYKPYSFLRGFAYDQLNRINTTTVIAQSVQGSNKWNYVQSGNLSGEYTEKFSYDQNGNILGLKRQLHAGAFDDLTYFYYDQAGNAFDPATQAPVAPPTNQLAFISSAGISGLVSDAIPDQSGNNYIYDKNGNLIHDDSQNISMDWNLYGKLKSVTSSVFPGQPNLAFTYDAMGNRASKTVALSATHSVVTYYVRDAQGNVMATYENDIQGTLPFATTQTLTLKELDIYGSKRAGVRSCSEWMGYYRYATDQVDHAMPTVPECRRILGLKSYEFANHLGNVLVVVSDRKLPVDYNSDNVADYFVPDITSANDYMCFGNKMPGRQFNNGSYKYGFNGQERDDEIEGLGNIMSAEFWEYDTRIGRRWNVDPVDKPWSSPYHAFSNKPIWNVDPNGANDGDYYDKDGKHLGTDGVNDDKVYTTNKVVKNSSGVVTEAENAKDLGVKHSELLKMAGVSYGESSASVTDKNEIYAISNAVQNARNGKTIEKTLTGTFSYAIGEAGYNSFMDAGADGRTGKMQIAVAGAINAVSGGIDYSGGATNWDGIDVLSGGSSHYRQQKAAFDSRKGIYDPNGYGDAYYINAQEYSCKKFGVNGKVYKSLKPLIIVPNEKGALWKITGTYAGSIFYKQIPIFKENKSKK